LSTKALLAFEASLKAGAEVDSAQAAAEGVMSRRYDFSAITAMTNIQNGHARFGVSRDTEFYLKPLPFESILKASELVARGELDAGQLTGFYAKYMRQLSEVGLALTPERAADLIIAVNRGQLRETDLDRAFDVKKWFDQSTIMTLMKKFFSWEQAQDTYVRYFDGSQGSAILLTPIIEKMDPAFLVKFRSRSERAQKIYDKAFVNEVNARLPGTLAMARLNWQHRGARVGRWEMQLYTQIINEAMAMADAIARR
ncbi:MAG: hypothetical protein ABL958_11215, partial [Bdellovibrionia bacterium]